MMDQWRGKVAVVTGAGRSALGVARRLDRLQGLKEIKADVEGAQFYPARCKYAKQMFGDMVNNAGVTKDMLVLDKDNLEALKKTMDVPLPLSQWQRGTWPGTSSTCPLWQAVVYPTSLDLNNIYPCSKYALTASVTVLSHELNYLKTSKIRVSNISPNGNN